MIDVLKESILAQAITELAVPLVGAHADFDSLIERIGDARFVLIGEASHGTHQLYRIRAELTKRLIREHGFAAVAVEADWPDASRVNRYVRGVGGDLLPSWRSTTFDASRNGCGATPTCSTVGFTTYDGTVTAASDWDARPSARSCDRR